MNAAPAARPRGRTDPPSAPAPVPPPPAGTDSAWRPAAGVPLTRWAADVDPRGVLPEYPRPQMVRPRWQNLNGVWELDLPADENARPAFGQALPERILVPFPAESALSGVMRRATRAVYRRTFHAPELVDGERLLLHFGAVDWRATVFVNGREVAHHTGGYGAFSADVTHALRPGGEQELVVDAWDPTDAFGQPRGKQATEPLHGLFYTPVTGIWQTVWMEPVPAASIDSLRMVPDVADGALRLTVRGRGTTGGETVEAVALADGREVGRAEGAVGGEIRVPVPDPRPWGPDDPFLYDLRVTLRRGGEAADRVDSYFGMRTVGLARDEAGFTRIALNGRPWFHVGPLDQGWWPDGLYTAPTDEALRSDVERTRALGFGFTRKHIKVEPARWYHHADRLGLPVWQDMPCGWNDTPEARAHFEAELREMLEQRGNHPCIVAWVPFNEKWGQPSEAWTREVAARIRAADPTRLIDDASGWQHTGAGDVIDVHRYQGPQALVPSADRATVVGEYGGLGLAVPGHLWRESDENWGYGGAYRSRAEMNDRYDLLMKRAWRLRDTHGMSAAVYTQLTDVEAEVNGLLTCDRAVLKFDADRLAAVNRGLAPLLLPEYGDFTDSVQVTVHQGTPTELRCTVDGSEPTVDSPVFQPFTLDRDATVRVRGFVDGEPTAAPEARMDYRRVPGRAPEDVRVEPGVRYEFFPDDSPEPRYRLDWPVRDRLQRRDPRPGDPPPTKTGTLPGFSLEPRDREEMFGFRFTGHLRVPATGVWTFAARSDDGVSLWIGEENVFWSMGQSPAAQEDEGMIALQAGLHPFVLAYHQAYGPMELQLFVEGPGMARQPVPASMLFHPAEG
jgi:Glycosyl hydrolases family 2, sugar binding domain/Glycosyl hydrolases family 2/PA14 domain/Chitobiase/beta-hexosaminidase C-terminal domain